MYKLEDAMIIGITGTTGKTSTAYLLHQYLKSIGKKSILYSSCLIDSPAGCHLKDDVMDVTFGNEAQIVGILQEAIAYEAEYIILECWETSILDGVFDNIPFDIKYLSNLYYGNLGHLSAEDYYKSKLAFFKDETEAKCIINVFDNQQLVRFINEANMTNFVLADSLPVNTNIVDRNSRSSEEERALFAAHPIKYSMENTVIAVNEQSATLNCNGEKFNITTSLCMPHLCNILACAAILIEAGAFDITSFLTFINDADLDIPGRMETVVWNDRTIIIDTNTLSCAGYVDEYVKHDQDHRLVIVAGYKITNTRANEAFKERHKNFIERGNKDYLPSGLNRFADFVYATLDSIDASGAGSLLSELDKRLTVPHKCIGDRAIAIQEAIINSKPGDIICITGRGNQKVRFTSYSDMDIFNDCEIVKDLLKRL